MNGRILLKNIYISSFITIEKKVINTTICTIIQSENYFWNEIEKIAIQSENTHELACWNCCLLYTSKSWSLPIFSFKDINVKYDLQYKLHHNLLDGINKTEFTNVKTLGNFCSIFCAVRYLDETSDVPKNLKTGYKNLLYFAYMQHTNKYVNYIPHAYPKEKMKIFCGPGGWTEYEYKEKNKLLEFSII